MLEQSPYNAPGFIGIAAHPATTSDGTLVCEQKYNPKLPANIDTIPNTVVKIQMLSIIIFIYL